MTDLRSRLRVIEAAARKLGDALSTSRRAQREREAIAADHEIQAMVDEAGGGTLADVDARRRSGELDLDLVIRMADRAAEVVKELRDLR